MTKLDTLSNSSKPTKVCKRVGRGPGSGKGKTCGRGEKGAGSRSGYKRRYGYEGGQFRMFMKLPIRGFNNANFREEFDVVNLAQIEFMYEDGEIVSRETLLERGFISGKSPKKLKILGNGDLKKKVKIHADAISDSAREKLHKAKIPVTLPE